MEILYPKNFKNRATLVSKPLTLAESNGQKRTGQIMAKIIFICPNNLLRGGII